MIDPTNGRHYYRHLVISDDNNDKSGYPIKWIQGSGVLFMPFPPNQAQIGREQEKLNKLSSELDSSVLSVESGLVSTLPSTRFWVILHNHLPLIPVVHQQVPTEVLV